MPISPGVRILQEFVQWIRRRRKDGSRSFSKNRTSRQRGKNMSQYKVLGSYGVLCREEWRGRSEEVYRGEAAWFLSSLFTLLSSLFILLSSVIVANGQKLGVRGIAANHLIAICLFEKPSGWYPYPTGHGSCFPSASTGEYTDRPSTLQVPDLLLYYIHCKKWQFVNMKFR